MAYRIAMQNLIYSKNKDALLLTAFRLNSHSELFHSH